MGLCITVNANGSTTTVKVDGRLTLEGAAELDRQCGSAAGVVYLDLSNLRSADAEGVEAIRALADGGIQLSGASPYIEMLLKRESQ
jgi:hypothetical protein